MQHQNQRARGRVILSSLHIGGKALLLGVVLGAAVASVKARLEADSK